MVFSAPFQIGDMAGKPDIVKKTASDDALVIDPEPFMISKIKTTNEPETVTETNLHTLNGIRIPFSPGYPIIKYSHVTRLSHSAIKRLEARLGNTCS